MLEKVNSSLKFLSKCSILNKNKYLKQKNRMKNKLLYIGLNGYAGAGKDTVAKMLAYILNFHINYDKSEHEYAYQKKCAYEGFMNRFNPDESATEKEDYTMNSYSIAFADQLKEICSKIMYVPVEYFYHNKSNSWICINKGFEFTESKPEQSHIITASDYYYGKDSYLHNSDKFYMSLRELLVYVGTYVLQDTLGKNVFINLVNKKIQEKNAKRCLKYVICTDVRFLHEFDYIREHNGVMINIVRDSVTQLSNVAEHDLDDQDDFDYIIENNGDYKDLFGQVWDIVVSNIEFMNLTVDLDSHDGSDNYLVLKSKGDSDAFKDRYVWTLMSEYGTCRTGHDNGEIVFIDPSGGPMIEVGRYLHEITSNWHHLHKITRIWFDEDTGKPMISTQDMHNDVAKVY